MQVDDKVASPLPATGTITNAPWPLPLDPTLSPRGLCKHFLKSLRSEAL